MKDTLTEFARSGYKAMNLRVPEVDVVIEGIPEWMYGVRLLYTNDGDPLQTNGALHRVDPSFTGIEKTDLVVIANKLLLEDEKRGIEVHVGYNVGVGTFSSYSGDHISTKALQSIVGKEASLCRDLHSIGITSETIGTPIEDRILLSKINREFALLDGDIESIKPLHEAEIRKIMEGYGESLLDLDTTYGDEFLDWFKINHPTTYGVWQGRQQGDISGEDFLLAFSSDTLGGLVYENFDEILVAFANQSPEANNHLHNLLEGLHGRE
jgi:hypothetical protein